MYIYIYIYIQVSLYIHIHVQGSLSKLLVSILIQPDFTWHIKNHRRVLTPFPIKDVPPAISRPADVLRMLMLLDTCKNWFGNPDIIITRMKFNYHNVKYYNYSWFSCMLALQIPPRLHTWIISLSPIPQHGTQCVNTCFQMTSVSSVQNAKNTIRL